LLARDGHDVTVVEREDTRLPESPDDAWTQWERKGVAQFRQPHNFMPGLRRLVESELPDIEDALVRAGASRFDLLNPLPPFFVDRAAREGDDALWTWTARRPVGEWVLACAARNEPRVTVRQRAGVTSLLTDGAVLPGVPHVCGVRTTDGEQLGADLVVDATGRQSASTQWLTAVGARPPYEEHEDSGFVYYSRFFRGPMPQRVAPVLTSFESFSVLTLPGDNNTWSVTLFTATGDQPLKALRHEETWTRTLRASPLHAHWIDGEPITPVLPAPPSSLPGPNRAQLLDLLAKSG
jgi:2-polyprenyl-6-methoxyphenol hydroxylase-like FAD-dependent oxidoreductase